MPRGKVIFIVEGELEKDFLHKQCATRTVIRKIPSNGENVAIERLAIMIKAILDISRNPIRLFVILDREKRDVAAEDMENSLFDELRNRGLTLPMSVHVADRMVENWIIADPQALATEQLVVDIAQGTEGVGGKSKLKKAFRDQNQTYSERVDGVRLLERCQASAIAANSPSFARLYASINAAALPCFWIQR